MENDAISVFIMILMKMLELLERSGAFNRDNAIKKPVIKPGKINKGQLKKLMKNGADFKFFTVDKNLAKAVEDGMVKLGGACITIPSPDGNSVAFGVPSSQMELFDFVNKSVLSDIQKNSPEKIKINDGIGKIDAKDMPLVTDVLRGYDVPVTSFKDTDGRFINIVSSEYANEYNKAMAKAQEIQHKLDGLEIIPYKQTENPREIVNLARYVTSDEAAALYKAVISKGLDVKFDKRDDKIAICYPKHQADYVKKELEDFRKAITESDKYLVSVHDKSFITLDKETLFISETDDTYFMKVPGTHGEDYIKLNKADCETVNNGQAFKTKLEGSYTIFDREGNVKGERTVDELMQNFERKTEGVTKNTKVLAYGSGSNRIELYNKDEDKLISIGLDKASEVRMHLNEAGISGQAQEKILKDIDRELAENRELRIKFDYVAEQTEPVYTPIMNLDSCLAQTYIAETVLNKAQLVGTVQISAVHNGDAFVVVNKADNTYTIGNREDLKESLSAMGFGMMVDNQIERIVDDKLTHIMKTAEYEDNLHVFTPVCEDKSGLAGLDNVKYGISQERMIIIQDNADNITHVVINKGESPAEIEAKLTELNMPEKSVAVIMKQAADEGMTELPESRQLDNAAITRLTNNMVEIRVVDEPWIMERDSYQPKALILPMDKVTPEALATIGIWENTADAINKSLSKAKADFGKTETLTKLKSIAKETIGSMGKTLETVKESITRTQR